MDIRFTSQAPADVPCDLLAVAAGPDFADTLQGLDERFDGQLTAWLEQEGFGGKPGSKHFLPTLGRLEARLLLVVGIGDGEPTQRRKAAGAAGRVARKHGAKTLALALGALSGNDLRTVAETAAVGNYTWDRYQKEDDRKPAAEALLFVGVDADDDAVAGAGPRIAHQAWARDLVNTPGEDLYPESLAQEAQKLARIDGVEVEVWGLDRCRQEQCVGIEAVGRGSDRPGRLIHLRYRPADTRAHVALVGKGVTFDSGGLSLKPGSAMQTMRCDMGGAATVLGAFGAAAEIGVPVAIDCFVGSVENLTGSRAYKLGDILEYPNGVSVEIHNTDAEGRLVLADCLIKASQVDGVTHIVDAATLTGACVVALGSDYTGLFTDDDDIADALHGAAQSTGEGLWRLPLHGPYKKKLEGHWSTIKNVGGRDAGAITAALFLQHFVEGDKTWAHLDIAGPAFVDKEHGYHAPGATGEMVRTLTAWIEGLAAG